MEKPYHLLDKVIALHDNHDLFDRLLGLVTQNPRDPLNGCRPPLPFKAKNQFKEPTRLYPEKAVECTDVEWLAEQQVTAEAKLEFTKLLNLWGSHNANETQEWSATLLRRVEIDENPRDRIKELLENTEYKAGVRSLMDDLGLAPGKRIKLAVIVGFITCTDMKVNGAEKSPTNGGAAADVKQKEGTSMAGTKTTVGLKLGTSMAGTETAVEANIKKTRHTRVKGAYEGEVLLACYYLPIFGEISNEGVFSLFGWWSSTKVPPQPKLNVGSEPVLPHHGHGNSNDNNGSDPAEQTGGDIHGEAIYKVGRFAIPGNMRRPLGTSDEGKTADEEIRDREDTLRYLEAPHDLDFTISKEPFVDALTLEDE